MKHYQPDSKTVAKAIDRAFDFLGPEMKKVIMYHLDEFHEFVVGESDSLIDLNNSLLRIFEPAAAEILMERVYLEVDKIAECYSEC